MKNDKKAKQDNTTDYKIRVELPNGNWAEFAYSNFELADGHYTQLQAQQVVGQYGIKTITRSWRR